MDFKKFIIAQRRGSLTIVVLALLKTPRYGYELTKLLNAHDYVASQSTLYPMLRRFESEGILTSSWKSDGSREQKYYSLTSRGLELQEFLYQEWEKTNKIIEEVR